MKLILANGCYDLLHYGHLLHLKAAARMGTHLIVAITKDASVHKGPGRPVFTQDQRETMLRALRCVDGTVLVDDVLEALETLRPDIWVLGQEYVGKVQPQHWQFCLKHRIDIAFTDEQVYSSTKLLAHGSVAR